MLSLYATYYSSAHASVFDCHPVPYYHACTHTLQIFVAPSRDECPGLQVCVDRLARDLGEEKMKFSTALHPMPNCDLCAAGDLVGSATT